MLRMMIIQLGVIVFAICLSTQVVSQNTTMVANSMNTTNSNTNITTNATETNSSMMNSTSAAGAGVSLRPDTFSILIPIVMAASLLHRYC